MASLTGKRMGRLNGLMPGVYSRSGFVVETEKDRQCAVLLSERKGVLVRVEKGAYYRPKKSQC